MNRTRAHGNLPTAMTFGTLLQTLQTVAGRMRAVPFVSKTKNLKFYAPRPNTLGNFKILSLALSQMKTAAARNGKFTENITDTAFVMQSSKGAAVMFLTDAINV